MAIKLTNYFCKLGYALPRALFFSMVLALFGCASSLDDKTYSRDEARQIQTVQFGTIEDVTAVIIEGNRSAFGGLAGGVIGGVAGSGIGSGTGQDLATAVGAVLGSVAGREIEQEASKAQGVELTLRMDDGRLISIVQEVTDISQFVIGERVKLLSSKGIMRATPLVTKPAAPVQSETAVPVTPTPVTTTPGQ